MNPNLKIEGVLMTLVDSRTTYSKTVPESIIKNYGSDLRIFRNQIPMRIKAAETPSHGISIFAYEPKNDVAIAYKGLAKEVIRDAAREKAVRTGLDR